MKESAKFVIDFLEKLNPLFKIEYFDSPSQSWTHRFLVQYKKDNIIIEHSMELIEDFDIALTKNIKDDYYYSLEYKIKFNTLIPLGEKGWIIDFPISSELLNEKRKWQSKCSVNTKFNNLFAKTLYEGLKKLRKFLQGFIENSTLKINSLENDLISIDNLIEYYESEGNLNSRGADVESLSFLKAAAIVEIIFIENQKKLMKLDRVKIEYDKSIYKLVKELRSTPFIEIELPECLFEFYSLQNKGDNNSQILEVRPDDIKLDSLLDSIDIRLKKKKEGAWLTFKSNNPDRLSQSANSMVELLDDVISLVIGKDTLEDYLKNNYGYSDEIKWIEVTRKWIAETKSNLHRVKHHIDYKDEIITEKLLSSAEMIMFLLLSHKAN